MVQFSFQEQFVHEFFEQISDAFFALDFRWRFTYVNKEASRLLLREHEKLLGRNLWVEFPEAIGTRFYQEYYRALREQVPVNFQGYFAPLHKWFEVRAYPFQNGLSVFFHDVTEKQETANEEKYYRSLFLENPDAIFTFDLDGSCLSMNPSAEKLTGYSSGELFQLDFTPLIFPNDLPRTIHHFELAGKGIPQTFEFRMIHKNGRGIDVQITNVPIAVDGKIVGVYGIAKDITQRMQVEGTNQTHLSLKAQDITELKRIRQQLLESQERYRSLLVYNPDGVGVLDLQGFFSEANPVLEKLTGYTREELLQMTFLDLVLPKDREIAQQWWGKFLEEKKPLSLDIRIMQKDGQILHLRSRNIPVVINNKILEIYTITRDITEQKRTEELLRKSEKLTAVGQLAAAIAHEVRNPLTSLKGFTQLLQSQTSGENKEYYVIMLKELERIELISSELLVLAKPQAPRFESRNIKPILQDVVTLLESQAIMNNVQVVVDISNLLPSVQCDENQLKQVFVNIIKNAIEAMPDGGILHIQAKTNLQNVRIEFMDQGNGIPEEKIPKMGEAFYTTKEKGTGLGLMVTYKIIEQHKGFIEIKSEVGKGTTISVELPGTMEGIMKQE